MMHWSDTADIHIVYNVICSLHFSRLSSSILVDQSWWIHPS